MTALDVLAYLQQLRVRLTLTPALGLRYRAPKGVMTRVLMGTIKACQAEVTRLLVTGEDTPLPTGMRLPERDYSRFLTWQTGKVPASAQLMASPLPEPLYHDVPSPPETVTGRACPTKCCQPTTTVTSGHPASLYYKHTGLCVACYARVQAAWTASKRQEEDHDLRLF